MEIKKGDALGDIGKTLDKVTPPIGANRAQRRALKKGKMLAVHALKSSAQRVGNLENIDDIIDEEKDISALNRDIEDFSHAQDFTKTGLIYYRILRDCGLSEGTARRAMESGFNERDYQQMIAELDPLKARQNRKQLANIQGILMRSKLYRDQGDEAILKHAFEMGLSVEEIWSEIIRSNQASIDLMKMQVDYIRAKEEMQRKMDEEIKRQKAQDEQLAQLISEEERQKDATVAEEEGIGQSTVELMPAEIREPFPLADWNIYWTNRFWSDNPNQLTQIDTSDREVAIEQLEKVGRGTISVSVGSVVRALEFHLHDRDKIQRALATRNKYAPEEIRRWVKVKRGKDRIGILVDEERPNTAIFFVGGRDVVYRGL